MIADHAHAWRPVDEDSTDHHTVYRCAICGADGHRRWPRVGYFEERPPDDGHPGDFALFRGLAPDATPRVPAITPYADGARTAPQRRARRDRERSREAFRLLYGAPASSRALISTYVDDPASDEDDDGTRVRPRSAAPVLMEPHQLADLGVESGPERVRLAEIAPFLPRRLAAAVIALAEALATDPDTLTQADRLAANALHLRPGALAVYRHRLRTLVAQEEDRMPKHNPITPELRERVAAAVGLSSERPSEFHGPRRTPRPAPSEDLRRITRTMTPEEVEDRDLGYSRSAYRPRRAVVASVVPLAGTGDRATRAAALGSGPVTITGLRFGKSGAERETWFEGTYPTAAEALDQLDRLREWRRHDPDVIYGIAPRARATTPANESMQGEQTAASCSHAQPFRLGCDPGGEAARSTNPAATA